MPSFKTAFLAVAAAAISLVRADYVIDPTTVPLSTRTSWCSSELSTCPLICEQVPPGTTLTNTCDPTSLTYGCVCGNGLQPNVSEYSLTLPYFVCVEWGNQCVTACGQDNTCSANCRQDHPCGAQNPTRVNSTSSSMIATATASGSQAAGAATTTSNQVFTGLATAAATTGTSKPASNGAAAFAESHSTVLFTVALSFFVLGGTFML